MDIRGKNILKNQEKKKDKQEEKKNPKSGSL
jgi:hypothetical protein